MKWNISSDRASASANLALWLADCVNARVADDRRCRLALSGGTTPEAAYRTFAAWDLAWEHLDIALVDDRWVGLDDLGSNERLVRACFEVTEATIIGLVTQGANPEQGATIRDPFVAALRPFDSVVLGIGLDGHTASFFPNAMGTEEALDLRSGRSLVAIHAAGSSVAAPWPDRVTLTLPVIAEARQVALLAYGTAKRDVLEHAATSSPIGHVKAALGDRLEIFWAP
jgi:6-phosphogluconolactonase